jgi:hypothetical protein
MTQSAIHSLVIYTVQHLSFDRLHRAVCGLAEGSLTISLTRQTAAEIRALVKNGDGSEYGVTLTEALTTCSCKDALYRGVVCKHAVAVALHVLRTPQQPKKEKPPIHLMWQNGEILCGGSLADGFWVWPWTDYMLTWPEACPACVAVYRQPKTGMTAAA